MGIPRRHRFIVDLLDPTGELDAFRLLWLLRERIVKGAVAHDTEKSDLWIIETAQIHSEDAAKIDPRERALKAAAVRIKEYTVVNSKLGCWEWKRGLRNKYGYGKISVSGKPEMTHRVAYEAFVGPIPKGLYLDHLCRNPICCNPAHLEPVTASQNALRGIWNQESRARRVSLTHCPKGHPYAGENLYVNRRGYKICRECLRGYNKAAREAKRAARGGSNERVR